MTKQAHKTEFHEMEHVWKDISDTMTRLNGDNDNPTAPFALTREVAAAGRFTDDMVKRIYARYDFCEGYTNAQLADLKCLAMALEGNVGKLPEELLQLQQTLTDQANQGVEAGGPTLNQEDISWKPYSHGAKTTWPEHHQNLVFGPQFSYPLSARFDGGTWYRHGSNTPLQGVTKYMHVTAPQDWS